GKSVACHFGRRGIDIVGQFMTLSGARRRARRNVFANGRSARSDIMEIRRGGRMEAVGCAAVPPHHASGLFRAAETIFGGETDATGSVRKAGHCRPMRLVIAHMGE